LAGKIHWDALHYQVGYLVATKRIIHDASEGYGSILPVDFFIVVGIIGMTILTTGSGSVVFIPFAR